VLANFAAQTVKRDSHRHIWEHRTGLWWFHSTTSCDAALAPRCHATSSARWLFPRSPSHSRSFLFSATAPAATESASFVLRTVVGAKIRQDAFQPEEDMTGLQSNVSKKVPKNSWTRDSAALETDVVCKIPSCLNCLTLTYV